MNISTDNFFVMSKNEDMPKLNDTYCSISFNKDSNKASNKLCLTTDDIKNINEHLSQKISNIKELENKYNNPYDLLKNLNNHELIESIKFNNLKPEAKVDKFSWLNNSQLDQVQEHFKRYFKGYYYSYIHMSDVVMFDNYNSKFVDSEILDINDMDFIDLLKNNKNFKYYGVIFNTDTSNKSGQHWFAIFMDFNTSGSIQHPYTIEYFNSAGTKISSKLNTLFNDLALKISTELNKVCTFIQITNIQHQAPSTGNCGVYSLFYIYSRLMGVPYTDFNIKVFKINDDIMTQIRKIFFNDIDNK